jgi:uncharacterized membrane protein YkoI
MYDKNIEQRISNAVKNVTPDVLDNILSSCDEQKGNVIMMNGTRKKRNWFTSMVPVAALLVMICAGGVGYNVWKTQNTVNSTIMLDVNPSISLNVNEKERVISVMPHNDDAKNIIGDMDLKGSDLDVAVNALVGSMFKNGYLTDLQNAILVSVENGDANKSAELQVRLSEIIDNILKDNQFESAVFSQTVFANSKVKELAKTFGISEGKAALILAVIEQDNTLTFETLAPLSVNEIVLIMDSKQIDTEGVTKTGHASQKGYISYEEAKAASYSHAGVSENSVKWVNIEFGAEDGIMVYELEFKVGTTEYEYDINAVTGEVVKFSKETENSNFDETQSGQSVAYIGEAKAKAQALTHAKVTESQVTKFKMELDKGDDGAVYEIEFETSSTEYDYVIDAIRGTVLEHESEPKKEVETSGSNTASKPSGSSTNYISEAKAKAQALAHAKVNESHVINCTVELDKDDDGAVYEIEFETSSTEYDYVIDAIHGTVLESDSESKKEVETSGSNTTSKPSGSSANYISEAKAKAQALAHAKVTDSQVTNYKAELDEDDDGAIYEIEFETSSTEYDYVIDGINGTVLEYDSEPKKEVKTSGSNTSLKPSGSSTNYIGEAKAKVQALVHANVTESQITNYKAELDEDDDGAVYELGFKVGEDEYEYEIDAITGSVIKADVDKED